MSKKSKLLKPAKAAVGKPAAAHPLYNHEMQCFLNQVFGNVKDIMAFAKLTSELQTAPYNQTLPH